MLVSKDFTIRKTKPKKGNKFYTRKASGGYNTCVEGKPADACDAVPNCVGFAEGRVNEVISEILGKDTFKYDTLNCNAEKFIERAVKYKGVVISDAPIKGGIMVWQKGETLTGDDGAGHVEFVEDVLEKDENGTATKVYNSASNYNGSPFFNVTRTNSNGRWGLGSKYKFRGCIVFPEITEFVEDKIVEPEQPTEPAKKPEAKIKVGDTVIVNGVGNANSLGTGAKTKKFKNQKMKVIGISSKKTRDYRYALNQYNRGTAGNWSHVTAWFREEDITK